MKKFILFVIVVILLAGTGAQAQVNQVEIKSRSITIGNGTADTTYNISLTNKLNAKQGVYISNDAALVSGAYQYSLYVKKKTGTGNNVGIRVQATNTSTSGSGISWGIYAGAGGAAQNYGIYTELSGTGAAVYASDSELAPPTTFTGTYAGYFKGPVYVEGDFTTTSTTWSGNLFCYNIECNILYCATYNGASLYSSPGMSAMSAGLGGTANSLSYASRMKQLRTVEYTPAELMAARQQAQQAAAGNSTAGKVSGLPAANPVSPEMNRKQVGFALEELREAFPDLVREQDGKTTVNYTSLIPILVETIKELTQRLETLEGKGMIKVTE